MQQLNNFTDEELEEMLQETLASQENKARQMLMVTVVFVFALGAVIAYYPHYIDRLCGSKTTVCLQMSLSAK